MVDYHFYDLNQKKTEIVKNIVVFENESLSKTIL